MSQGQKKLKVTFPNGNSYCYKYPVDTIVAALNEIGADRFPDITLESSGRRIITQEVHPDDDKYKKHICGDWWYINKLSNTDYKVYQIAEINRCLSLDLMIESGEGLEVTNKANGKHTKSKKQELMVTFKGDGTCIDYESYKDVYRDCVYKLGVNKIARCNLEWKGQPLVTTTDTTGKRTKIDSFKWIVMPNTTKDAVAILKLLASFLKIELEIQTI